MKYVCPVCGYVYDEATANVPFKDLQEDWVCPLCKAPKKVFTPQTPEEPQPETESHDELAEDMKELTVGELAALLSNLARGCEKQYKEEESRLFTQLADYFTAAVPPMPDGDMQKLRDLLNEDLKNNYQALDRTAKEIGDRGALRASAWGQKVSTMIQVLLDRYEREGEAFLQNTNVWICTVCGFIYIGDDAPPVCPVCRVPNWKFEKVERRAGL